MFPMLFCAAVIWSAIFNSVEAGCFHSQHECDDGEIHGQGEGQGEEQGQGEAPSEHDWIFNMGTIWMRTHDNICAGAGIKPTNREDPVKVVTTASCIEKIRNNAAHLASIGGESHVLDLTLIRNLFVHRKYRSAINTPQYDIAVVKVPRRGNLDSELDNWIELPPQGHRPPLTNDYSGAFYAYQDGEYQLMERDGTVAVVEDRRCGRLVENSRGALFCVHRFPPNAITGAPLYRSDGQGNAIMLVGLYQDNAGANLDRFISVSRHAKWIQGL